MIRELLARGRTVRALVRSVDKARAVIPEGCELIVGDVTDAESVRRAVQGCTSVFHAAGLPEQWLRDDATFDRVNAGGTRNVADAALSAGVEKFVYTSTIDVFAAEKGAEFDESVLDPNPKGTAYERSKQTADQIVVEALARGLPAIFLHPSAVYGPAPEGSPGLNDFFVRLLSRKVPALLPGGMPVVFAPDVGVGHVLAEEKAKPGARYILSERYLSFTELAQAVLDAAGQKQKLRVMPLGVARAVSSVTEAGARVLNVPPLIPRGQLTFLQWEARPANRRAQQELGWRPTPFDEGLQRTLAHLRERGRL